MFYRIRLSLDRERLHIVAPRSRKPSRRRDVGAPISPTVIRFLAELHRTAGIIRDLASPYRVTRTRARRATFRERKMERCTCTRAHSRDNSGYRREFQGCCTVTSPIESDRARTHTYANVLTCIIYEPRSIEEKRRVRSLLSDRAHLSYVARLPLPPPRFTVESASLKTL